jgi:hypothetical protein
MQIVNFTGDNGTPRGDTFKTVLTFEVDINGWTFWMTVKKLEDINDSDDTDAVIQEKVTIAESTMICTIELTPVDTDVVPKIYKYDIQIKQPDGSIATPFMGDFEILPSITRAT